MNQSNKKTRQRFIAFLDIMGLKNLIKTDGIRSVYQLYSEIDEITRIYRTNNLIVTYYSDSIMAATLDDSIDGYQSLVLFCARIEAHCIKKGYAVNGAISFGSITIDRNKNIWLGKPLSSVYEAENNLFFYGIVLDNKAYNKAKDYILPVAVNLHIADLVTNMIIPLKNAGWKDCPCINWFEFIGDKVGDPYQNQIAPLRKYIKTLYEKYKHVGRGFYYISNTEMVAKQWYDFAGQRNQSEGWGNLILEEYLSDNIRIEEGY